MDIIESRKEYMVLMNEQNELVKKADLSGGFENLPGADIETFRQNAVLLKNYERNIMKLYPLEGKNPLITRIEEEMFERRMKQKELAGLLEVSGSKLSGVINGKIPVSMSLAKKLHKVLGIDGNLILENT
ncbi:MAG: helix-turn-helix transcriptional regulator [Prevotellaceae bacterium]|jgi:HTH-type transcriptional regulator/antitoxin HigA|nr:helix-turn-helix transcriptional regulator [Prevotellaceae bacterium]